MDFNLPTLSSASAHFPRYSQAQYLGAGSFSYTVAVSGYVAITGGSFTIGNVSNPADNSVILPVSVGDVVVFNSVNSAYYIP